MDWLAAFRYWSTISGVQIWLYVVKLIEGPLKSKQFSGSVPLSPLSAGLESELNQWKRRQQQQQQQKKEKVRQKHFENQSRSMIRERSSRTRLEWSRTVWVGWWVLWVNPLCHRYHCHCCCFHCRRKCSQTREEDGDQRWRQGSQATMSASLRCFLLHQHVTKDLKMCRVRFLKTYNHCTTSRDEKKFEKSMQ